MKHNHVKKKKIVLSGILICLISAILYTVIAAVTIWNYGDVDERRKADTAIVLGAGATDAQVSPVFRERLNHGIWLYQNGYVTSLIITGGYGKGNQHSDSYMGKQYALAQGIPEEDILIEETSTITEENLEHAKSLMDQHVLNTAIIVSDPLHMKRAMLMAKDYGIVACSSPTPTTMYISNKTKLKFLGREVFFYIGYQLYRCF